MNGKSRLADDPIDRFQELRAGMASAAPELSAETLEPLIDQGGQDIAAVADHITRHSSLTAGQATSLVARAVEGKTDARSKAAAVSAAATKATAATADIELSDPVMLNPLARLVFALLLFAALAGCIVALALLGDESGKPGSALIGLAVVGVLTLVGILVLVMGYKNVTIKGGPPSR